MSDTLPFTGERFTPECEREIAYEHWHRYAFARSLARGRRVLDAACGEGYGSALLARAGAASVLIWPPDASFQNDPLAQRLAIIQTNLSAASQVAPDQAAVDAAVAAFG